LKTSLPRHHIGFHFELVNPASLKVLQRSGAPGVGTVGHHDGSLWQDLMEQMPSVYLMTIPPFQYIENCISASFPRRKRRGQRYVGKQKLVWLARTLAALK